jgi:uncharacterized SAM-binding protein YcdF (DUF218 family)
MIQANRILTRHHVVIRLVALLIILWIPLAWLAARKLIVTKSLAHADVLVVLSGSSTYIERAQYAAQLFREGRASRVVLTNDGLSAGYAPEIDGNPSFNQLAKAELKRAGVPDDRIETIAKVGSSTHDEATFLREYSEQHNVRTILIVTSAYHSRRALWVFEHVFRGTGITMGIDAPPAGLQTPRPITWWTRQLGWKLVPGEYVKLIYYVWRY